MTKPDHLAVLARAADIALTCHVIPQTQRAEVEAAVKWARPREFFGTPEPTFFWLGADA